MTRHKKSLLERAQELKSTRVSQRYSNDELELVRGWLDGIVTISQVTRAMEFKSVSQSYTFLAIGARIIHQDNKDTDRAQ